MYEIEIYKDKNGKSEVYDYIKELQQKNDKDSNIKVGKIFAYIRKLSIDGLAIGEPFIKRLQKDIWELRPLRDRILFVYWGNNKFVLLSFFVKKTRKTPKREIEKAKRLLEDYKKRSEKNE